MQRNKLTQRNESRKQKSNRRVYELMNRKTKPERKTEMWQTNTKEQETSA